MTSETYITSLPYRIGTFLVAQWKRICLQWRRWRTRGFDPWFDFLEEEMVTHSRILTWKSPWTEEPVWSQRAGCEWTHTYTYRVSAILVRKAKQKPQALLFFLFLNSLFIWLCRASVVTCWILLRHTGASFLVVAHGLQSLGALPLRPVGPGAPWHVGS